ncbi:selenium-dependent molybdenum cofactor biosynthesis protein YqeB [Desulfococcaceae bacterium HSG9]|nr:selenium-dependent molybdenum cofactor biosynthesis protein YqeB [Desulfococcaceae bacterium HSG9]
MTKTHIKNLVIAIKGAGEMASGIAWHLFQANFKHIFMMEIEHPVAVRRQVSFCEAIHDGSISVEGVTAKKASDIDQIRTAWNNSHIPVVVDPGWDMIKAIRPHIVIDAIIAKKNLGTHPSEAELVIGLGPGFEAGKDVHIVIETNRGHNLGRIITQGCAEPDTGTPGNISGYTKQRVIRAPCKGKFTSSLSIGTLVKENDIIGLVENQMEKQLITARIAGVLRGQIRNNTIVKDNFKIGDIDPRGRTEYCATISEKARSIAGSVLEAVLREYNH